MGLRPTQEEDGKKYIYVLYIFMYRANTHEQSGLNEQTQLNQQAQKGTKATSKPDLIIN